ncbi:hypothetical protein GGR57DRAFT_508857 [Xylariaceae sp. FL1272]|nr:hypothetical protein GGR57DRAFT_508857 [Xylariaceae sp. FL1272]
MKLVNPTAEALRSTQKRVHELEIEQQLLKQEIARLRSASQKKNPSPSRLTRLPKPSSLAPNHARPTTSSLAKCQSAKIANQAVVTPKPVFTIVDEIKYVYKDGVPIPVAYLKPGTKTWVPLDKDYMKQTESSMTRKLHISVGAWERRVKSHVRRSAVSPSSRESWYGDSPTLCDDETISERQESDRTEESKIADSDSEELIGSDQPCDTPYDVPNLDVFSRLQEDFDDNETVRGFTYRHISIDSAIGLQFLRRAMALVQETIFPLFRKHREGKGGPHLILLGRDELIRVIGEFGLPWLAINGHSRQDVCYAIMKMPPLRNAIAHPRAEELSTTGNLDYHLQNAQEVAFIFRDFEKTMEIRKLRDELVAEAKRSEEYLGSKCGLATMPFSEGVFFEPHLHEFVDNRARWPSWDEAENRIIYETAQSLRLV